MSYAFHAMGTEVTVDVPGVDAACERDHAVRAAALFAETERRTSRFDPASELSRLNRAATPMRVSPELFEVLVRARVHFDTTRGLFDPGIGAALASLGYDRSFAPGALDRATDATGTTRGAARATMLDLVIHVATRTVERAPALQLDLGGIVKGLTVDRAAARLPSVAAIDAGGDAVLRGAGPDGTGWLVEVEDPADPARVLLTLRVSDSAVATSGSNRRRWVVAGETRHHLIDPRTGRSARTDLAQVTVVASSAERAEVLAKAVLVAGAVEGRALLAARSDVAAVLVDTRGDIELVGAVDVVEQDLA